MTDVTKEEVIEAIGKLTPGDESHFTKSGSPDATVLTEMLSKKVSAELRDEAWAECRPADPADAEGVVSYTNMTKGNIFTSAGRCGGGCEIMLSPEEAALHGVKVMLTADVPVVEEDE